MVHRTKLGSAGRFGVRYGLSLKKRISSIESRQDKKQVCPYCRRGEAVRTSKGIWNCKKCKKVFAGHTYYLEAQDMIKTVIPEKSKVLNNEKTVEVKEKKSKKSKN